jgi:hypothetical protein
MSEHNLKKFVNPNIHYEMIEVLHDKIERQGKKGAFLVLRLGNEQEHEDMLAFGRKPYGTAWGEH